MRGLRWERGGRRLLDIPRLDLQGPALVLLLGASGGGKSSLLKALTGTLHQFQGGLVAGEIVHEPERAAALRVGHVPQDARDTFLGYDAETEFQLRLQAAGRSRKEAVPEASHRLAELQYQAKERIPFHRLSAGEQRRLALRAVQLHEPGLLLLDEPLNDLDAEWAAIVRDDVVGLSDHVLVVVAVHDPEPWLPHASQVVILQEGRVIFDGPVQDFQERRHEFSAIARRMALPTSPTPVSGPPRLSAVNLTAGHDGPLFEHVSLDVGTGIHAIIGPNGGGKSTLLRILAGLERPRSGVVEFDGADLHAMNPARRASFLAYHLEQPGQLFYLPTTTAEIEFQLRNTRVPSAERGTRVDEAQRRYRVKGLARRHPVSLSGGEQERLALACLDAARPRLLVLDEPTHGLDADGWRDLLRLLQAYRHDACILLATHDRALVQGADTAHELADGRLRPLKTLPEVLIRAP